MITLVSGILFAIVVFISYFNHSINMEALFNSDSIHLSVLFDDIFSRGGDFFSWHLTPAPYFFPDMAVFFGVKAILGDIYKSFFGYGLFQLFFVYLITLRIISQKHSDFALRNKSLIVFSLIYLLVVSFLVVNSYPPYFYSIFPLYRYGTFINTLILLSSLLSALKSERIYAYFCVALISLLGMASDLLFLAMAIAPALAATLILVLSNKTNRSVSAKIIASLITGGVLGISLKSVLAIDVASGYILAAHTSLLDQLKLLGILTYQSTVQHWMIVGLVLFFYSAIVLEGLYVIQNIASSSSKLIYLIVFLILSPLLTGAAVVTNGILVDSDVGTVDYIMNSRYIINFFWFPVTFFWLPLRRLRLGIKPFRLIALFCIFLSLIQVFPLQPLKASYYPPLVQCIDTHIADYEREQGVDITRGISHYWQAKLISQFSEQGLVVFQVLRDLSPFIWINNPDWYNSSRYDFALISSHSQTLFVLDKKLIKRLNGEPSYSFSCIPNVEVLVYGPNQLRTRRVEAVGESFVWKACELPTQMGVISEEDCTISTPHDRTPGYLTFGPYESLPAGTYKAEVDYDNYSTQTNGFIGKDGVIGEWDVVVALADKAVPLYKEPIVISEDTPRLKAKFEVPKMYDGEKIEVRTFSNGLAGLRVNSVTIERLE